VVAGADDASRPLSLWQAIRSTSAQLIHAPVRDILMRDCADEPLDLVKEDQRQHDQPTAPVPKNTSASAGRTAMLFLEAQNSHHRGVGGFSGES